MAGLRDGIGCFGIVFDEICKLWSYAAAMFFCDQIIATANIVLPGQHSPRAETRH
jgi:hypothetical protein